MKKLTVCLVSHLVHDFNLGCSALAISNLSIIDEIFEKENIKVKYLVIMPEPKFEMDGKKWESVDDFLSIKEYTQNEYECLTIPRLKTILKHPFKFRKHRIFKESDIILNLCGGDGFTDIYGRTRLLAESIVALNAKKRRVPVVYCPQTIGPFETKFGIWLSKKTLKSLSKIYVRDDSSYNCCKNMGLENQYKKVIDVAFRLPYNKLNIKSNRIKVGINISGLLYNGGYNKDNYFNLSISYKDFIDEILEKLSKNDKYEVHLISHVIANDVAIEDDFRVCKELAEKFGFICPKQFANPVEAKSYISSMDIFSGARMHSTIAAISSGVPVIPVAYSRKFNGLYKSLSYPYLIDCKDNKKLDEHINDFFMYLNNLEELKKAVDESKIIYDLSLGEYVQDITNLINKLVRNE